jgi:hypothetical protein
MWISDEPGAAKNPSSLHGFLNSEQLMELVVDPKNTLLEESEMFRAMQRIIVEDPSNPNLSIKLYKGVNIYNEHHVSDESGTNETFTLHCNQKYRRDKASSVQHGPQTTKSNFSFVEVYYGCDKATAYGRVMAIVEISFTDEESGLQTVQFLIVNQLTLNNGIKSPLLFPLATYAFHPKQKNCYMQHCFDFVDLGDKFRPVFGRPFLYRTGKYVQNQTHSTVERRIENEHKFIQTYQFFIIPYDRVGKTPSKEVWPQVSGESIYKGKVDAMQSEFPLYSSAMEQRAMLIRLDRLFALKPSALAKQSVAAKTKPANNKRKIHAIENQAKRQKQ